MILFLIKLVHTLVFFLFSGCVLYTLFCGITNRFPRRAAVAILLVFAEGVILLANGWECPITTLARDYGAGDAQVADIFLPRWFADRLFTLCTPLFLGSCLLLLVRRLWDRRARRSNAA